MQEPFSSTAGAEGIATTNSLPQGIGETAPSPESGESAFSFGPFRLEADGTLWRGGAVVHLPPKELAALRLLSTRAGQIVTPLQLRQALWGEVHVAADSVPRCISSLRARLEPEQCIQTVYKRGYRFSAEVRRHDPASGGALPRLAVLPFRCEYNVAEHLGHAVAEETITRLTGMRNPIVFPLARDSVFALARRGLTAHQVGEKLHADLALTGTLRALPQHLRLRAEMIRVEDGTQIWVEDLMVALDRIGGLESELTERLIVRLSPGAPGSASAIARLAGQPSGASNEPLVLAELRAEAAPVAGHRREAYELFQRAHHEWQTLQRHRMQDGLQHLLRAIDLDPTLIAALVDLVNLCVTQAFYGYMSPATAAGHVRRAAELGAAAEDSSGWTSEAERQYASSGDWNGQSFPDLPPSADAMLPALGWIAFHVDHDLPAALHAFSQSAHLPHDPWITRSRAMFSLSRHRFDEAIEWMRAAIEQDPYSPWLQARMAWALHLDGKAAASVDSIRRALTLFPDHEGTNLYGASILAYNGDTDRAVELAQSMVRRLPYFDLATAVHAYALACSGRVEEARTILERLQWMSRERFVLCTFNASVYVALGDPDSALKELQTSVDTRCPWFFQMLADPRLAPLHGRPEFVRLQSILTRMEQDAAHTHGL